MIREIKKLLKSFLDVFNYDLISKKKLSDSDNPYHIITKFFYDYNSVLIVDAGASIGDISMEFSKLLPQSIIHSFEPYPKFYNLLKNQCKNSTKIHAYPFALSNQDGENLLHINQSEGTNSLFQSKSNKDHPYHDLLKPIKTVNIKTKRLDTLFPSNSIDILKLDLQGGELNALKGAKKLLEEQRIKCILCEVMFERTYEEQSYGTELMYFLENHGFYIFNFYQKHFHYGQILQADVLFVHNSIKDNIYKERQDLFIPFSKLIK